MSGGSPPARLSGACRSATPWPNGVGLELSRGWVARRRGFFGGGVASCRLRQPRARSTSTRRREGRGRGGRRLAAPSDTGDVPRWGPRRASPRRSAGAPANGALDAHGRMDDGPGGRDRRAGRREHRLPLPGPRCPRRPPPTGLGSYTRNGHCRRDHPPRLVALSHRSDDCPVMPCLAFGDTVRCDRAEAVQSTHRSRPR